MGSKLYHLSQVSTLFLSGVNLLINIIKNFFTGNLIIETNLMSRQKDHFNDMRTEMSKDARDYYSDYFERYISYLSPLFSYKTPQMIEDTMLHDAIERSLLDKYPLAMYK